MPKHSRQEEPVQTRMGCAIAIILLAFVVNASEREYGHTRPDGKGRFDRSYSQFEVIPADIPQEEVVDDSENKMSEILDEARSFRNQNFADYDGDQDPDIDREELSSKLDSILQASERDQEAATYEGRRGQIPQKRKEKGGQDAEPEWDPQDAVPEWDTQDDVKPHDEDAEGMFGMKHQGATKRKGEIDEEDPQWDTLDQVQDADRAWDDAEQRQTQAPDSNRGEERSRRGPGGKTGKGKSKEADSTLRRIARLEYQKQLREDSRQERLQREKAAGKAQTPGKWTIVQPEPSDEEWKKYHADFKNNNFSWWAWNDGRSATVGNQQTFNPFYQRMKAGGYPSQYLPSLEDMGMSAGQAYAMHRGENEVELPGIDLPSNPEKYFPPLIPSTGMYMHEYDPNAWEYDLEDLYDPNGTYITEDIYRSYPWTPRTTSWEPLTVWRWNQGDIYPEYQKLAERERKIPESFAHTYKIASICIASVFGLVVGSGVSFILIYVELAIRSNTNKHLPPQKIREGQRKPHEWIGWGTSHPRRAEEA